MNARSISRTAVESSLTLVRVPLDAVIGRLPGNGTGARPTARLALDRADATLRAFAGTMLGDSVLRDDAQMRRSALQERERAQALRGEVEEKTEEADSRLQDRQDQVARQRAQAELRAKSRRDVADRQRRDKTRRADELERKRLAASENAAGRADEAINRRAPKARLETLDAKSDALRKKEAALTASDEASRLGEAASRAKAARKAK
jgi:hypothetical protein